MNKIINTTQLQQTIGRVTKDVSNSPYIVINRGKARAIMLPYFEDGLEKIEEYFEDYIMQRQKDELQNTYTDSFDSGESDLVI